MSVSLSGELVFKVTFDQHGFPIGMYTVFCTNKMQ